MATSSIYPVAHEPTRSVWTGVLIGVGVAAFLDETVFHQLLHWHHFYDQAVLDVGLVSDGFFHAGSWLCVVAGLFLFADLQRRQATWSDGVGRDADRVGLLPGLRRAVPAQVLGLHQIRYGVGLLPYDLAWNISGGVGFVLGLLLLMLTRRRAAQAGR